MKSRILSKYFFYYPALFFKTEGFFHELDLLQKSQYFEKEKLNSMMIDKIQYLIKNAKKNTPFYKKFYKKIECQDIKSIKDLEKLPFISKTILKQNANLFKTDKKELWITKKTTGGSTGQPVTILKNREAFASELAAMWRGYGWAGIKVGDRQARFWGVPISRKGRITAKLTDLVCNRRRFSAFSYTEQSFEKYTQDLNNFKPDYLYGYVSMLCDYADYVLNNDITLEFKLKAIITTSEVLYRQHRRKLQAAFGCDKIFDEYGCGEVGTIAHECEAGNMHISAENLIVEIFDGERPCIEGDVGEIVVTDLSNITMPLIRYRLGDFAKLSSQLCSCGKTLPIIKEIKGRAYDTITLADGKKFHGEYFMYVMEEAERKGLGVSKFQIIQKNISNIIVRIVPNENYNEESENFIVAGLKKKLSEKVSIDIEIVKNIFREKSGKMRLIIGLKNHEE